MHILVRRQVLMNQCKRPSFRPSKVVGTANSQKIHRTLLVPLALNQYQDFSLSLCFVAHLRI